MDLFTQEEFEIARFDDLLPIKCDNCGKIASASKRIIYQRIEKNGGGRFCSKRCQHDLRIKEKNIIKPCAECGKIVKRNIKHLKKIKSNNFFCNSSCAASYNNKHKSFGIRVSKLEKFIQENLAKDFPELEIIYNQKEAISSELDIFIPKFLTAIEISGIYHFEPIYGTKTLQKIQKNDNKKVQECLKQSIQLFVIDTRKATRKTFDKYYQIVFEIIKTKLL